MRVVTIKVIITGPRGETAEASANVTLPSFSDRLLKGSKVGLILLGVTFVSAFIPLVHFVTVPLGLLVSGVFLFLGLTKSKRVEISAFTCPSCSKPIEQNIEIITASESFYTNCPICNVLLKIRYQ